MKPKNPRSESPEATPSELAALRAMDDQFRPVLLQFFQRRVKDRSEAEDLVQEVFVRLLKRGNVADLQDIRGYLFQTAASALTDRARKNLSCRKDGHVSFDVLTHAHEDFSSDRVLSGEETLTRVSRALLELPERARTVFVLRRLEGLRYQDIAQRLGISVSLVEKQMARAVAYLTQRMGEE